MAAVRSSPTVRRRRLAMELRRLREAAGLTCEDAGRALDNSGAKISRMETGRVGIRARDVRDLLEVYGVTDEAERETLLTLARESRQKGWWHTYGNDVPKSFQVFVGLEEAAVSIRTFEVGLIPGLLQTPEYARSLFRANPNLTLEERERYVDVRMARQKILTGEEPTHLWVIVDEGALHRVVGDPATMREQLQHLVDVGERPNITIQVVPFVAGAYTGMGSPFTILSFSEAADPDVIALEPGSGNLYLEKDDDLRRYRLTFQHLQATAISPADTLALILGLIAKI